MMNLGGTTPLNIILKFPSNENEKESDDEFSEWEEDDQMKIKRNTGLQEIKWIRF